MKTCKKRTPSNFDVLLFCHFVWETYRFTFTKGNPDHIAIFLGPFGNLLNVAVGHLHWKPQVRMDGIDNRAFQEIITHMGNVSSKRKARRTRKRDFMRSSSEHAVHEPVYMSKDFASTLKSTQGDNRSEDNSGKGINNIRISDAIDDDVRDVLSLRKKCAHVEVGTHLG